VKYSGHQIIEEDYVYHSFVQSKMYAAGVVCSDCHEPHSNILYANDNSLCSNCHSPQKFDSKEHHFHKLNSTGALCVDCHMPETTYMIVDQRRDHSFLIPRPDVSLKIGTPDACTKCHNDKSLQWSADTFEKWYGKKDDLTYGEIIYEGRRGNPKYSEEVAKLCINKNQPAMYRATALRVLENYPGTTSQEAIKVALKDKSPLVRSSALLSLNIFPQQEQIHLTIPYLDDQIKTVRLSAIRTLSRIPKENFTSNQFQKLQKSIPEYNEAELVNDDRPESYFNLAILETYQGNYRKADSLYNLAIELDSLNSFFYINYADLYRAMGNDNQSEKILIKALQVSPNSSDVYLALGLLYSRQNKPQESLAALENAIISNEENTYSRYVYAIALNSNGKIKEAIKQLNIAYELNPYDRDVVYALTTISRDLGDNKAALKYARELKLLLPDDPTISQLILQLERM